MSESGGPRRRVVFLNSNGRHGPWDELASQAPPGLQVQGWSLTKLHEWQPAQDSEATLCLLVDLDAIAATKPLDDWALNSWRNTFNDLIVRCTNPEGRPPLLLGYTREPTWESAWIGLRIGARDATKLSRLDERLAAHFGGRGGMATGGPAGGGIEPPQSGATGTEQHMAAEGGGEVIPLRKEKGAARPSTPAPFEARAIPKHAIPFPIEGLEGSSAAIEGVRNLIRKSAPLDTTVLIAGPTGSGKERVAKAIHRYSQRAQGPFVAVNCGAVAPGLIEAELFGHVRGAFTGAVNERVGLLAAANGGTLFLDEVSELPGEFQVKLLRSLQDRQITPVGSSKAMPIDIRVVSATKEDLDERMRAGSFREDLLFRLRVMEIVLPALRERRSDIPELAKTILKKIARRHKKAALQLSESVLEKFLLHAWPGNVRELENVLEHASTLCWAENRETLEVGDLPESVRFATMSAAHDQHLKEIVRRFEREYIASTVRRLGGSKEHAAEVLGLSLATLYRKIGA